MKEYTLNYEISNIDALRAFMFEVILWMKNVIISWLLPQEFD